VTAISCGSDFGTSNQALQFQKIVLVSPVPGGKRSPEDSQRNLLFWPTAVIDQFLDAQRFNGFSKGARAGSCEA